MRVLQRHSGTERRAQYVAIQNRPSRTAEKDDRLPENGLYPLIERQKVRLESFL